jgi:VWFA-related protein
MDRLWGVSSIVVAAMVAVNPAATQQRREEGAEAQPSRFAASATAIIVDVVVRDRQGAPVTDLRLEDFELLEDGVPQTIADLTAVGPGVAIAAAAPRPINPSSARTTDPPAAARTAVTTPTFVALVFDRLSPEARALAHKGALAYLDTHHEDDFAGVFLADRSLVTIQTFTNDRARLRHAIRDVASRATSGSSFEIVDGKGGTHPSVPDVASAEHQGRPPVPADLARYAEDLLLKLTREYHGYGTTDALLALTTALGTLPGRKTVVFFAEGISIPDPVLPRFGDVIATANRSNVSIYTIDAAGLRVHSKDAETKRAVQQLGNAGVTLLPDGSNMSSLASMQLNEDVLRRDPRTGLTMLAEQTGGFLVQNTNDLGGAFHRIDADRRFHYLLAYTPRNPEFKGEWRSLTVNVPGRRVTVRARAGYFAVHTSGVIPLLAYEAPALAALDRTPRPRAVSIRMAAFAFPEADASRLALLVTTPAAGLTFSRDERAQTYATDFTILARIRNADGEAVRKASQPYRLTGPLSALDAARNGDVLFFRHPTLAPGKYIVEAAIYDALSRQAGVDITELVIPAPTRSGLQVGSLIVVRRGERVQPSDQQRENPLAFADVLLYPNLGEPVSKEEKAITLFFTIAVKSRSVPAATLEVVRGAEVIASIPVPLDPPDARGTIRQIAQVPSAALPAGDYLLRLVVSSGEERHIREAQIRLMN